VKWEKLCQHANCELNFRGGKLFTREKDDEARGRSMVPSHHGRLTVLPLFSRKIQMALNKNPPALNNRLPCASV
jgi:hypothetical protein